MSTQPPSEPEQQDYGDHAVIVPPHRLKTAIVHTAEPGDVAVDVIERAEAALASLKGEFSGWMRTECDLLEAAAHSVHETGVSKVTLAMLFRAAHDIKGDAATLGYPLAGRLAAGLCRLLYHAPDPVRIPLAFVDCYVAAIRAVVREDLRNPHEPTAVEVAEQLAFIVEKFLAAELKDGYAEIAAEAAPLPRVPEA